MLKKPCKTIFHAKLKRDVQTYFSIKQRQNFVIKTDGNSCQISATVFTFGKFIWFVLGSFLENPVNIFHISILNTVCLKKGSLIQVIAECHYVNLFIFLITLGSLICSRRIWYTVIKGATKLYSMHYSCEVISLYFVQYGFVKVCIVYRFFWKTSFLSLFFVCFLSVRCWIRCKPHNIA